MKANLIEAGNVEIFDRETEQPFMASRVLVIQFDTDDAIRQAVKDRMVEFTLFEHYTHKAGVDDVFRQ